MESDRTMTDDNLMARLERSLKPGGWRERVGCTCSPGDGSRECPRVDECMEAWQADKRIGYPRPVIDESDAR